MKKGKGKFILGTALGVGLGMLFAPNEGAKTRKVIKNKLNELIGKAKEIDLGEVKDKFSEKISKIQEELEDLDKEKAIEIAKKKGKELKQSAEDLLALAKEKGTPVLEKTAKEVLNNVIKYSEKAVEKLGNKNTKKND